MSYSNSGKFYTLLCIGAFLIFMGCSKEPEAHSIVNVEDQFELKLHQKLSVKGGIPVVQISTLKPQECSNAFISLQSTITENEIRIILNDVVVEGTCIAEAGIISEEILLNTPKSGSPIEIILKDAIANYGTFYSDNTEIEMVFSQFDGLKISKTHLNKIQQKMMWGSFSLSKNEVYDQFNDYLQELDINNARLKGDYGHFYLSQDESVIVYGDENDFEFSFLISTEEYFDKVTAKFQEFKELDQSLVLKATNYDGSAINIQ